MARYAQGSGIDEPLSESRGGTNGFYEQDGLGSVTSLSISTGVLADTYTYNSFGALTAATGTLANPFQYTGRDYDAETGLRYYRARYYDPVTGRFISEDPAQFWGDINFYQYVNNTPVNMLDPTGLLSFEYNVKYRRNGWVPLLGGYTFINNPIIHVRCDCIGRDKYKLSIRVVFPIDIVYGTDSIKKHEDGHMKILQDYLEKRTGYYASKYEQTFSNYQACADYATKRLEAPFFKDLKNDFNAMDKAEHDHDDLIQRAIEWLYKRF
ncbi:MAG TPA: RHS repeat-associated core domain-containing protein [Candidatus Saccharimonadales bacterium]|nr:RHS repeat-associated core domain-containing protein [Candidatus Saccharimonadales bacterium]